MKGDLNYLTSSYIIGTGYQDFPFLWYNYGTKIGFLSHFFTGNTFKELFAKVRKIFDTQCSFDDLISTLDGRLSGCPLCPIHPEFITSFDRDTPRLIFEWPGLRNISRLFENGVGLIRLSGCITPKQADKLSRVDMFRLVASGLDRLHRCARMGTMVIGGMVMVGIGFALGVVGDGGSPVYYSYHKQCPQFSEGVYGPTGPAPNST